MGLNTIDATTLKLENCIDKCEKILNCRHYQPQKYTRLDEVVGSNHPVISVNFIKLTKIYSVTRIKDGSSKTAHTVFDILDAVDELLNQS